jgi:hypothetical protein
MKLLAGRPCADECQSPFELLLSGVLLRVIYNPALVSILDMSDCC